VRAPSDKRFEHLDGNQFMSTRESMVPREAPMLQSQADRAGSERLLARIFSWPPLHRLIYLAGDLLAITLAHTLALHALEHFLRVPTSTLNPLEYHRFYIPFFAVVLYLFDGYKSPELRRPEQELERSCKAVVVSFVGIVSFNFVVFRSQVFSRYLLVTWFVLATVLLVALRFALRAIHAKLWKAGLCRRRAVLIGSPAGLARYQELISIQRHHGYDLAGVVLDFREQPFSQEAMATLPVLGSLDRWEECLAKTGANLVIVAYPIVASAGDWLGELLQRCQRLGVDVELYSGVLATANLNYEYDEFSGCFLLCAKPEWSLRVQRAMKRAIDVAAGLIGSIVTVLLTPLVWTVVNLEDRGPVFHRREFVGTDGKIHHYRKFRTMRKDADEILRRDPQLRAEFLRQHKLKDDPRLLRAGRVMRRYSLDEFPQFFSVLSGKLTLVGPRVISGEERQRYGADLSKLLSRQPGLTGFWQVMGRQTTSYEERIRMDMFYVERWSIWLDLVIIAKTFWKVLQAEGAY
jgi:exopolysaccharide biosynthesis polyprenyl glycosylphosphotransferase